MNRRILFTLRVFNTEKRKISCYCMCGSLVLVDGIECLKKQQQAIVILN